MDENRKNDEFGGELEEQLNESNDSSADETEKSVSDRASEILSGLKKSSDDDYAIPDAIQDWDGVLPENENVLEVIEKGTHIIEEIKPIEDEEEIPEEELCVLCGKRRRCTSISEDYEYCAQCRINMLKRPFNVLGIITTVLVLIIFVISMFVFAQNALVGLSTYWAYKLETNGYVDEAMAVYEETMNIADQTGMPIPMTTLERYASVASKNYDPSSAKEIILQYINTYQAEESEALSEIIEASDRLEQTIAACQNAIVEYYDSSSETIKAKEAYAALQKIYDNESADYDKDFIVYFMSNVAAVDGDDEKRIEYLEKIRKDSPERYWMYNSDNALIDTYSRTGQYDAAVKIADEILKINKTNQDANWLKAKVAIMDGDTASAEKIAENLDKVDSTKATAVAIKALIARLEGKYEEAIEICTEAIDADTYNSEVYHQAVIATVLNGSPDVANNMLSGYEYTIKRQSDYTDFLYIAALVTYTEDEEKYKEIVENNFEGENAFLTFPEELRKWQNKEMSLEEIFLKGDFDLT